MASSRIKDVITGPIASGFWQQRLKSAIRGVFARRRLPLRSLQPGYEIPCQVAVGHLPQTATLASRGTLWRFTLRRMKRLLFYKMDCGRCRNGRWLVGLRKERLELSQPLVRRARPPAGQVISAVLPLRSESFRLLCAAARRPRRRHVLLFAISSRSV